MVCTPDAQKCIGDDLYECQIVSIDPTGPVTEWVLIEENSPQCMAPPVYTCPHCGAPFASQAELDAHIAAAHPPAVVPCEITITAPSSAKEGALVGADITVKNVSPYHYSYKATIYAIPDLYPDYVIGSIDQVITSGSSVLRNVSFTMPDCNVTVSVWVEREGVYDNSATRVVSLAVPATYHLSVFVPAYGGYVDPGSGDYPAYSTVSLTAHALSGYRFTGWGGDASGTSTTYNLHMDSDKYVEAYFEEVPAPVEFAGTMSRKQLEYNESRAPIPVYDIPEGQRGLVHIWGRNDMSTSEKLGIYWFVADPDGMIVEEYEDWQTFSTSPGDTHEFIGGRFNLDREKYIMWVELIMNPDAPEVVDKYIGDLCTVSAPEYKGSIARKELEYDETRGAIPVY
ncbi:hypothetical protein ES703_14207 [subsurface metagenome]